MSHHTPEEIEAALTRCELDSMYGVVFAQPYRRMRLRICDEAALAAALEGQREDAAGREQMDIHHRLPEEYR